MKRSFGRFVTRMLPLLSAGMLLQAGGCAVDLNAIASGLVTTITTSLISSVVFGAFGLAP